VHDRSVLPMTVTGENRPSPWKLTETAIGAAIVLAVSGVFMLGWWNLYLNPMGAGELFSLIAPAHGWLPYRDYYYQAPPGNIILLGWLGQIFGPKLIVVWALGILLNLLAALALYYVLLEVAPHSGAVMGSIVAFVFSVQDRADTPFWYFHQIAAFGVFGLLALLAALRSQRTAGALWCVVSGLCAGWCLAVKQTAVVLVFAYLVVPVVVALRRPALRRWASVSAASIVGGILAVIVPVGIWLDNRGLLRACVDEAFVKAPTGKGPLLHTLLRPLIGLVDYRMHRVPAVLTVVLLAMMLLVGFMARRPDRLPRLSPRTRLFLVGLASAAALALGSGGQWAPTNGRTPALALAGVASLGVFGLFVWSSIRLYREDSDETMHWWVVLFVSAAMTYGTAVSWAMGEIVTLPSLGVVLAFFWAVVKRNASARMDAAKITTLVLVMCALGYGAWRKTSFPSDFVWWNEQQTMDAEFTANAPELEGFRLSWSTAMLYEEVDRLIKLHVRPGDEILAFPLMQVFYGMAGTKSPTLCLNHWFDVCPDRVATEDARRLREHPPALIIAMELPEGAFEVHERLFRAGARSGQRDLWDAIVELRGHYKPVGLFKSPGHGVPIGVWARKARAVPLTAE
jgi:hypothetical protein